MREEAEQSEIAVNVCDVSMRFRLEQSATNSIREYLTKWTKRQMRYELFTALNHITFQVKKGEIFGIVGMNGSGKSTLLKIIAGVLYPSEGTVIANGSIAPLIELGAGFDPELTGRENIYLNGAILGYTKEFIKEQYDEIVDFAGIGQFIDMPLKNYSSGMVSRIGFAIATAVKPDILIADEILAVGDLWFRKKCQKKILQMMECGTTVLMVSHGIEQVENICNRALWLEMGNPMLIDDAKEVCRRYQCAC